MLHNSSEKNFFLIFYLNLLFSVLLKEDGEMAHLTFTLNMPFLTGQAGNPDCNREEVAS